MVDYFWDSYAVIELINGNHNYAKYSQEPIIITIFNLVEIYWFSINEYDKAVADEIYEKYRPAVSEIDDEIIKEAIKFRKKVYKTKKISYTDAIGYTYAIKNNLKFLTGDKEFAGLDNVEFVS